MTIARLASFLLWAVQFRIYSIPLQEFVFYVQNYCKTILCWISILTYFIGLMKALRQELISTKFFFFFFPLPSVLFADIHFQQNSPDLKWQMAWGNQRAPKRIIFPQMPSRAILAVKNTNLSADLNQSRNTAEETSISSVYGKNKAQVHLLKK